MKPHKCPVCNGAGTVMRPPWVAGDQDFWADNGTTPYTCGPCEGTGLVWTAAK
jgi:hypothetical protein